MVVHDFYVTSLPVLPHDTDSVTVVDPDAVLPGAIFRCKLRYRAPLKIFSALGIFEACDYGCASPASRMASVSKSFIRFGSLPNTVLRAAFQLAIFSSPYMYFSLSGVIPEFFDQCMV